MSTFNNFVQCSLSSAINTSASVIPLMAAVPPYNQPPTDGGVVVLTDDLNSPTKFEIVKYTSFNGTSLTGVTRGAEGTTAYEWPAASICYQSLTANEFVTLLSNKASLDSPIFTGTPTAPFLPASDNSLRVATTGFTHALVEEVKGGVPAALDTMYKLSSAISNDPNFHTTITNALANKVTKEQGKGLSTNDFSDSLLLRLNGIAVNATKNDSDFNLKNRENHMGMQPMSSITNLTTEMNNRVTKITGYGLTKNDFTDTLKNKLTNIQDGATSNSSNEVLVNRTNHTGTQPISSIVGLSDALDNKVAVVPGKGLSTNDYSDAEKYKVAVLGENRDTISDAPNDGKRYLRHNEQWSPIAAEIEYYDITMYSASPSLEGSTYVLYRVYPSLPITRPVLSDCKIGIADALGNNFSVKMYPTSGSWEAVATVISGKVDGVFTSANAGLVGLSEGLVLEVVMPSPSLGQVKGFWATLRFEVDSVSTEAELSVPQPVLQENIIILGSSTQSNAPTAVINNWALNKNTPVNSYGDYITNKGDAVATRDFSKLYVIMSLSEITEFDTNDGYILRSHATAFPKKLLAIDSQANELYWIEERDTDTTTCTLVRFNLTTFTEISSLSIPFLFANINAIFLNTTGRIIGVCHSGGLLLRRTSDWIALELTNPGIGNSVGGTTVADGYAIVNLLSTGPVLHIANNGELLPYAGSTQWLETKSVLANKYYDPLRSEPMFYVLGQDSTGYKVVPYIGTESSYTEMSWEIRVDEEVVSMVLSEPNTDTASFVGTRYGKAILLLSEDKYRVFNADTGELIVTVDTTYYDTNIEALWGLTRGIL